MRFELHIGTSNGAFHDDDDADTPHPEPELARILRELSDRVADVRLVPEEPIRLFDVNGNRVGFAVLTEPVKFLQDGGGRQ